MTTPNTTLSSESVTAIRSAIKALDTGTLTFKNRKGLRLNKTENGVVSWVYRYKSPVTKKIKQQKIARFNEDSASIKKALRDYDRLKDARDGGVDIKEAKLKAAREAAQRAEANSAIPTLNALLEDYFNYQEANGRSPKTIYNNRGYARHIAQLPLGAMPVNTITSAMAVKALDKLRLEGQDNAARVAELCGAVYMHYNKRSNMEHNPFKSAALLDELKTLRKEVKKSRKNRQRTIAKHDLPLWMEWLGTTKMRHYYRDILHITILTACRSGEICKLKWSDLNTSKALLNITETKTGADRMIPLSRQALALLERIKTEAERDHASSEFIFYSRKKHKEPIRQGTLGNQVIKHRASDWTAHSLRRVSRTELSRIGCADWLARHVLGHSQSDLDETYNKYDYLEEKAEWLQKLADHLFPTVETSV
jgi:integrase